MNISLSLFYLALDLTYASAKFPAMFAPTSQMQGKSNEDEVTDRLSLAPIQRFLCIAGDTRDS